MPDRTRLENSSRITAKDLFIGSSIKMRPEFHVDMIIGDDKLTRLFTGFLTYDAFKALAEYLEPKAMEITPWNGTQTKELDLKGKQGGSRCFHGMSAANQLFCVLARLRLSLSVGEDLGYM